MSFILGLFFSKWMLLILALVIIALVGAGKLIYNKWVLGALVLLALGFAAFSWHGGKVAADRTATAKPYIAQIKADKDKRDAEIAQLKLAADKATAENQAKERAWANAATKAKNDAEKRNRALQENAATAALDRDGLLRDLAASRGKLSNASADACRRFNNAATDGLSQGASLLTEIAAGFDKCASDKQTLISSWPH
jgi:hypothetical protein